MNQLITRPQAARMLRAARAARRSGSASARELIGWAFSALRGNRCAMRMKIDWLLQSHQFDSADALIARCLMHSVRGQGESFLRMRLAGSLYAQGRIAQAHANVSRVLEIKPHSCQALALAARIASDDGRHREAVSLLLRAAYERPQNQALRCELVDALLAAGMYERAAEQLSHVAAAPTLLRTRVLRARGQMLDAMETLDAALTAPMERNGVLLELIRCLEASGDSQRLQSLITQVTDAPGEVQWAIAQALLTLGEYRDARVRLEHVLADSNSVALHHQARAALNIAKAFCGTETWGLPEAGGPIEGPSVVALTAQCWLRGLLGQYAGPSVLELHSGSDPRLSVLQPLLKQAMRALDAARTPWAVLGETHEHRSPQIFATATRQDDSAAGTNDNEGAKPLEESLGAAMQAIRRAA